MALRPWTVVAGGLAIVVRLTPHAADATRSTASSNAPTGLFVLRVRVRAAASEGGGNAALIDLLAHAAGAGAPPRDATVVSGATARVKRLMIAGHGPTLAAARRGLLLEAITVHVMRGLVPGIPLG